MTDIHNMFTIFLFITMFFIVLYTYSNTAFSRVECALFGKRLSELPFSVFFKTLVLHQLCKLFPISLFSMRFFLEHIPPTSAPRLRLERTQSLPSGFRPYFTCTIAMTHLFMFIWMCWTTAFTEIGLSPVMQQRIGELTSCGLQFHLYQRRRRISL